MRLVYEMENEGTTMVARGARSNSAEGLCFGYSSVWCVKMQKHAGKNPLLTRPDQFEAFPLQQRVEMMEDISDWSTAVPRMIKAWGHECGPELKRNYKVVPTQIAVSDGHYIVDIGDHWVAAARSGGKYALFDSNAGMMLFDDAEDFIAGMTHHLTVYKSDTDPSNGWEDTHRIYKITE